VALTKCDMTDDEPLVELIELETRELLTHAGYPGDTTPLVRVSGREALDGDPRWTAAVRDLLVAVDRRMPPGEDDADRPFLLPVERAFFITGQGVVVTGSCERGVLATGQEVEVVGGRRPVMRTSVAQIEQFHRTVGEARSGDQVGLLLRGVDKGDVEAGAVVAAPGSIAPGTEFGALIYVPSQAEGGGSRPLTSTRGVRLRIRTAEVPGTVHLGRPAGHGEWAVARVTLSRPVAVEPGLRFEALADDGATAFGRVTRLVR